MDIIHALFPYSGYRVKHIKVSEEESGPIRVHLERLESRNMMCHRCGSPMSQVRGFERCFVEDLTVVGRKTFLVFRRLKAKCKNCRKVRLEACDFISKASPHVTTRLAFWLYRLCEVTPLARVAELTNHNKMTLWRVDLCQLETYFSQYKIPDVTHISVDEVYARAYHDEEIDENRDDRFFTVVTCLTERKVVWVEQSRRKAALDSFFKLLGPERSEKITVVATDEHGDYAASVREFCPNATHVLDRFHLVKNFEEAVNDTRKRLYKMLPQPNVKELARGKFRFVFLKADKKRNEKEKSHMQKIMKDNQAFIGLELIKERFLTLFNAPDAEEAKTIFLEIKSLIVEAGFPELKSWWNRIAKKWATVANYFKFRVTTALSEGINNIIKALKRRARGFQNMRYFQLKILQTCGFLSSRYIGSAT